MEITPIVFNIPRLSLSKYAHPFVVVREIHTKEAGKVIDATDRDQLRDVLKRGFDVVSDCLLWTYTSLVTKACIDAGTSHVDLSSDLSTQEIPELDKTAKDTGATIIPDCGQDPGIDNVVEGYAARKLDKVKKSICTLLTVFLRKVHLHIITRCNIQQYGP